MYYYRYKPIPIVIKHRRDLNPDMQIVKYQTVYGKKH